MPVYVDGLKTSIKNHNWQHDKSCHLVADTLEELHDFAKKINLNMLWFQQRLSIPHYDLTENVRTSAVKAGAIEITEAQLVDMMIADRKKKEAKPMQTMQETTTISDVLNNNTQDPSFPTKHPLPIIAFDTETELISYTTPVPELMCMTYCDVGALTGSIKTPWEYDIKQQFIDMITAGQHMVAHNAAFDLSILAFKYPDLLPYIFNALDRGLIHDTLLREKLLMLTLHGNFEMIELNGCIVRLGYKQSDLEQKYLQIDRSSLKNDADAPRMNYVMYKDVPLSKWDDSFINYAVDDAINCGHIYQAQEIERATCIEMTGYDPFKVEAFRVKISFALRLLECVGSRMDPAMVIEVSDRFRTEYAQPRLRNPLLSSGLLLDAVPAVPYANGALVHTEICDAKRDDREHEKLRKKKTCGCPPKMKSPAAEKNPTRPLFQYIWNLAASNPNIEAWLKKADVYSTVIKDKAFKKESILSTDINITIADLQKCVEAEQETNNNNKA